MLEEVVGHHYREQAVLSRDLEKHNALRCRLGLPKATVHGDPEDFRAYLEDRLDEVLGFYVLPWPSSTHQDLVARAVQRIPPFDEKGGGYRDSLVWANVMELAKAGHNVLLASADRASSNGHGGLADALLAEVEGLRGSVELAPDLKVWLLRELPWKASSVKEAVLLARDEVFERYYFESDLEDELWPDAEAIGFDRPPIAFEPTEVQTAEWRGRVAAEAVDENLVLAQYDIEQTVTFAAILPSGSKTDSGWRVLERFGRLEVSGEVELVVRVAVLFDPEQGMNIEGVSWRRLDGQGPGPGVPKRDPDIPLFSLAGG